MITWLLLPCHSWWQPCHSDNHVTAGRNQLCKQWCTPQPHIYPQNKLIMTLHSVKLMNCHWLLTYTYHEYEISSISMHAYAQYFKQPLSLMPNWCRVCAVFCSFRVYLVSHQKPRGHRSHHPHGHLHGTQLDYVFISWWRSSSCCVRRRLLHLPHCPCGMQDLFTPLKLALNRTPIDRKLLGNGSSDWSVLLLTLCCEKSLAYEQNVLTIFWFKLLKTFDQKKALMEFLYWVDIMQVSTKYVNISQLRWVRKIYWYWKCEHMHCSHFVW